MGLLVNNEKAINVYYKLRDGDMTSNLNYNIFTSTAISVVGT